MSFLRHVERTGVLLHLIDAIKPNIAEAYQIVQHELEAYKVNLARRPQIVVVSKAEGLDTELIVTSLNSLGRFVPARAPILAISAQAGLGLKDLLRKLVSLLNGSAKSKLEASYRHQQYL